MRTRVEKRARYSPVKGDRIPLLQERLVLNRYVCGLLGYPDFHGLREKLRDEKEGWAEDGHSYFFRVLEGLEGLRISRDELTCYDLRIKEYVERLNRFRTPPVQLKYFQYLAVLFTEVLLDRLFRGGSKLLSDLNEFVRQENAELSQTDLGYPEFTEADLRKVAFWMATGSGKTLVMHINLWQYLHYSRDGAQYDNILLVTPNEGLSRQHLEELRKSGIPAMRYGEAGMGNMLGNGNSVMVIEITKLTETKRGGGLSLEVDVFGPNNLLFVDEGHRGASGEVWRELRRRLAESGFTFEYSATFGQIVNGARPDRRPDLLEEYSKAILFDYSYPHFYQDGYGKDYWIINLKDEADTFNEWMLLGNLLSFYEQLRVYEEHLDAFRPYNLEKPLWVFVGHTVTGGKSQDDKEALTDVEQIVAFFDSFLSDREKWVDRIGKVLRGETGLRSRRDEDIFSDILPCIRALGAERIYDDIVARVFRSKAGERIRAVELKAAEGEIGLRAGADNPYFGVINIGDVGGLAKLLEGKGILREEENITGSLFTRINDPDSEVNVLIGSRKFMEGWDSFRVSSMGLMNIGKGEGAQIIQLFGRGVRLWGKGFSLKRSSSDRSGSDEGASAAPHIRLLETLNVFGVRANYMAQFREYLKQEGIETEFVEVPLPIRVQDDFLKRGLQVLRLPEERFEDRGAVVLRVDDSIQVTLDLRPRLESARSRSADTEDQTDAVVETIEKVEGEDKTDLLRRYGSLFDWDRIYFDLLEFRRLKGLHNLSFSAVTLREILCKGRYQVLCPEGRLQASGFDYLRRLEEAATAVLRKYVAVFYDRRRREWEQRNLRLAKLTKDDPNLSFGSYALRVRSDDGKFLERVYELVRLADEIYKKDVKDFPNIHFDRHLYQPMLLADKKERVESAPPGLNEGEAKFVCDLRGYLQSHAEEIGGKEVFLLRNLTRGRGLGFFEPSEGEAFYPDFILWVIQDQEQWISFIDPHGLRMARGGFNDPKVRLHAELESFEAELQSRCGGQRVHLACFILSTSRYEDLKKSFGTGQHSKEEFEDHNILFMEDPEYIRELLGRILDCRTAKVAG